MSDKVLPLVELRNRIASASDQAAECGERAIEEMLLAIELQVVRSIIELDADTPMATGGE